MMDELLKELAPVVASETQRASKQYGDKYASAHEAESVLREEVNELDRETSEVNTFMKFVTEDLHRVNNVHGDGETMKLQIIKTDILTDITMRRIFLLNYWGI